MRLRLPLWQCAAALIGALVLTAPAGASQYGQKLDSALQNAKRGGEQRVVIWGDNVICGDNVIWRDNIVWGEHALLDKISDRVTTLSILGGK